MSTQTSKPGQLLVQFIRTIGNTKGDLLAAQGYARQKDWRQVEVICKALVDEINTGELPAAMLPLSYEIAALLRPRTIIGRLAGLRRAPFYTQVMLQTLGVAGRWVSEGRPIPASSIALQQRAMLYPLKISAIRALSDEVMKAIAPGGDEFIIEEALASMVEALDSVFIDPAQNGIAGQLPASITSSAPEINSSGATLSAIDTDLKAMVQTLVSAQMSLETAAWIMSPVSAVHLAFLRGSGGDLAYPQVTAKGGLLAGLPVLTSSAVTASGSPGERYIALVEAGEIVVADDNVATVDIARHATLQLDDAPVDAAATQTSLWQLNLVGIRAARHVNWAPRRSGASVVLRNVTY